MHTAHMVWGWSATKSSSATTTSGHSYWDFANNIIDQYTDPGSFGP